MSCLLPHCPRNLARRAFCFRELTIFISPVNYFDSEVLGIILRFSYAFLCGFCAAVRSGFVVWVLMGFFWATGWHCGAEPAPLSTGRGIFSPGVPSCHQCCSAIPQPAQGRHFPLAKATPHSSVQRGGCSLFRVRCPHRAWPAHPPCRRHPRRVSSAKDFFYFSYKTSQKKPAGVKLTLAVQNTLHYLPLGASITYPV